jgi:hypothetical protein
VVKRMIWARNFGQATPNCVKSCVTVSMEID